MRRLLWEAGGALGWMAAFLALALAGWAWGGAHVAGGDRPYPATLVSAETEPSTWLVDGFNLLNVALLRGEPREAWWRAPARGRVMELARGFDDPRAEVVVVFDGRHPAPEPGGAHAGPRLVFAESADDWVLAALRLAPEPARVAVVTADRRLAARARQRGAQVVAPAAFVERCRGG